jgi:short-subunit dehydrogenase
VFAADLSPPEAPALIFDFVHELRLHVDFLVNNAGSAFVHCARALLTLNFTK